MYKIVDTKNHILKAIIMLQAGRFGKLTEQKEQKPDILERLDMVLAITITRFGTWGDFEVIKEIRSYLEKSLKRDEQIASFQSFLEKDGDMPVCRAWALMKLKEALEVTAP